jgi:hypothetical protein
LSTALIKKSPRSLAPAWLLAILLVILASWVIGPSLSPRLTGSVLLQPRNLALTEAGHPGAGGIAGPGAWTAAAPPQAAAWPAAPGARTEGASSIPTLRMAWEQATRADGPGLSPAASAVLAGALLLGMIALLLAVTQRQIDDVVLAGACLLWAAHTVLGELAYFVAQRGMLQALLLGFCGLTGWYSLRVLDVPLQRGSSALPAFGLTTVALLVWALGSIGAMDNTVGQILVLLMIVAMGLVLLAQVIDAAHQEDISLRHRQAAWAVALALSVALACLVHELGRLLGVANLLNAALPAAGSAEATRWAVLVLLTVLTGVRMDQVARSMRRLERSRRDARQHARQTQRSLQVTLDELHSRERSDAQRQQRDRLLRELHDDIGQRVARAIALTQPAALSAVAAVADTGLRSTQHGGLRLAESGPDTLAGRGAMTRTMQLQGLLDTALLDLQLVLSSLDRGNPVLAEALIELCRHIEPLMHVRGARLQWQMAANTTRLRIGAAETLQLQRIAQEVLVEVLHAQDNAGDASVALDLVNTAAGRQLRLQICAGVVTSAGSDALAMPGPLCASRDWTQIHQRAKVLGASVAVAHRPEGWGLEICLPIGAPAPAST